MKILSYRIYSFLAAEENECNFILADDLGYNELGSYGQKIKPLSR